VGFVFAGAAGAAGAAATDTSASSSRTFSESTVPASGVLATRLEADITRTAKNMATMDPANLMERLLALLQLLTIESHTSSTSGAYFAHSY
jgi:hypothetical protein